MSLVCTSQLLLHCTSISGARLSSAHAPRVAQHAAFALASFRQDSTCRPSSVSPCRLKTLAQM